MAGHVIVDVVAPPSWLRLPGTAIGYRRLRGCAHKLREPRDRFCGTYAAIPLVMTHFASIELGLLSSVTGGADAPAAPPQQPPPQPKPQAGSSTQWMQNTATCARIGGPVLGAICGAMTPTPAY